MTKLLIELLEKSPELLLGLLLLGASIFLLLVSMLSVRASKAYYENVTSKKIKDVEKNILSKFSGYENKILTSLDNIKKQIDFRKTKVLLLNDIDDKINRVFNLCDMKNIDYEFNHEHIEEYSSIVIYLKNESDLDSLQSSLIQIPDEIIKVIYFEGFITNKELLPTNHVFVNFEYTLIEKLHSIYLVKKIMEK